MKTAFVASVVSLVAAASALAQPVVSSGDITNTTMFGHMDPVAYYGGHYYTISANAGDVLTISATRLTLALDPTIYLFSTSLIGLESGGNTLPFNDPSYITYFDDEVDSPGPYGDPLGDYLVPATGIYTLYIYSNGSNASPSGYDYSITVSGSSVPTPGAAAALGLAGAGLARRRRR